LSTDGLPRRQEWRQGLIRFTHTSGCLKGSLSPLRSDSRVRGARVESYGSFGFICALLCDRATILFDPDETLTHSPWRVSGCCLLHNVADRLSHFTTYEAVSILRRLRTSLRPGHFPVYASSMSFRHPFASQGSRLFVGNAVAPAMFNGFANINATLGSYFWLGFITTGLSPDKKRLALLGAQRLKLIANQTKSKVCLLLEAIFLGFTFRRGNLRWTDKSQQRFKARIRNITRRNRGVSPKTVMFDLAGYIRGAVNYYGIGLQVREARDLDGWIRRRVRLYYWKQWKRPRTRRRNLLKLGAPIEKVHMASRSRKGPWRIRQTSIVRDALPNQWLTEQGVISVKHQRYIVSQRMSYCSGQKSENRTCTMEIIVSGKRCEPTPSNA